MVVAGAVAAQGWADRAAGLWGAAEGLYAALAIPIGAVEHAVAEEYVASACPSGNADVDCALGRGSSDDAGAGDCLCAERR